MALVSVEANALGSNKGVEQRGRSELGRSHDLNCLQIPSLEELSVDAAASFGFQPEAKSALADAGWEVVCKLNIL